MHPPPPLPRLGRRRRLARAVAAAVGVLVGWGCEQRSVVTVTVGAVDVQPRTASFVEGDSLPFTATVSGLDGEPLPRAQVEWTTLTPDLIAVTPDGLVRGVAAGQANIRASFRGVTGTAAITVIAAPLISVEPDSLVLLEASGSTPPSASVAVRNGGGGQLGRLSVGVVFEAGGPQGWLTASLDDTDAPATITVTTQTSALPAGRYKATVNVSSPDDAQSPLLVPVSLSLAGFTVTETDGETVVTEAGGTDTVSVALDAAPDTTVVLGITTATPSEVIPSPTTLTFTPTDWNTPREVVLTGQNELLSDGDQMTAVTFAVDSAQSDVRYHPVPGRTIEVTTIDDDDGGFTLGVTSGSTQVSESGVEDAFSVVLDAQPLIPVVLRVRPGDTTEVSTVPTRLTFTPENWSTLQIVTVRGADDDLIDGSQTSAVYVVVDTAASDPAFVALGFDSIAVTTLDDDVAGIFASGTPPPLIGIDTTSVSESGTIDTILVVLDAEPATSVVLRVTADDPGEVDVTPAAVTFAPAEWNKPKVITVAGVDDRELDGSQTTLVRISVDGAASDDAFDAVAALALRVTTTEDDVAGFTIIESGTSTVTAETGGASDDFTVALRARPAGNVAINLTSGDLTEVTVSPLRLTFTPDGWNTPQVVTVSGVDERFDDGDQVVPVMLTVDTAATHPDYDSVRPDTLLVTNADDDTAGFIVAQTGGGTLVNEGGSQDTVTVVLNARPVDDVVITLLASDSTEASVAPPLLTFTTDTWATPQAVIVTGVDDSEADGNRFSLVAVGVSQALSDAAFGRVADQTVVVTTINDDGVTVTLSPTAGLRTDESGGTASFDIVLGSAPSADVTISLASSDPGEGQASPGTLTFTEANWSLPQSVTVTGVDDELDDGDQNYSIVTTLTTTDPDYVRIDPADVQVTNGDNDAAPTLSVADATVTEGDAGTVNAVFTVTQSLPSSQPVTVVFVTANQTATAGTDYSATSGTLTFAPGGPLTQAITVAVTGDLIDEGSAETFSVILSGATNATIEDGTGVGTITDDDDPSTLSIVDVAVVEGNGGTVNAGFTVTLSAASALPVTVSWATAQGTATLAGADFVAASGSVRFLPGQVSQQLFVVVNGDLLDEGTSEEFTVVLSNAVDASIAKGTGVGTITDDDDPPTLSIADATVNEGNTGTVNATFTVSQSTASGLPVTVDFATAEGTATLADSDYADTSGTLTFLPGAPLTQAITVAVNGDLTDEGVSETFTVSLSGEVNATIAAGTATGTIVDDEGPPTLWIEDVTVTEGDVGTVDAVFTVTQSALSADTVRVDFATTNGTALAGVDYVANSGTLTFPPGTVTQTVTVLVNGDLLDEGVSETFTFNLSNPTNATIVDPSETGTITDDDTAAFAVNDIVVLEGNGGTTSAVFTVTKSLQSSQAVSVGFATADGTATVAGNDYVAASGALTFLPNAPLTQSVTVLVNGDLLDEGDSEVFTLGLNNVAGATIADGTANGTITDDDDQPTLSITGVTVTEGNSGTVDATFTVTQSAVSGLPVSVNFSTVDGSATVAGSDYAAQSGTLTFPAGGSLTQPITVTVNGDLLDEGTFEDFSIQLTGAVNASIATASATGTINDDETATLSIDDVVIGEGNAGTTNAVFTVTKSLESSQAVTVAFATADGTATGDFDYVTTSGTLTFPVGGSLTQEITVTVNGDVLDEGDAEDYTVVLSSPVNVSISKGTANGTITDDDDQPTLSIAHATVAEGAGTATFTVSLSAISGLDVSADYATADLTATAGSDYTAVPTTQLQIPAGSLSTTVTVPILQDALDEIDEVFRVDLSSAINATIADGTANGTITDDDTAGIIVSPTSGLTVDEDGPTSAIFTVRLASEPTGTVVLDLATDSVLQIALDLATLTFDAANWATARDVTVAALDDPDVDGDVVAVIDVTVDPVATADAVYDAVGPETTSVTVVDDDNPGFTPVPTSLSLDETGPGSTGSFTFTLDARPRNLVTVTITNPSPDEVAVTQSVYTISPGGWNTVQTVNLTGQDDGAGDGDETFNLTLTMTSSDPVFNGLVRAVQVTVIDNGG